MRTSVLCVIGALLSAAPVMSQSFVNTSISFDGVNDYAVIADSPTLLFGNTSEFTVEMWLKIQGPPPAPLIYSILEKWNGSCATPYPFTVRLEQPGKIKVAAYDTVSCSTGSGLILDPNTLTADGEWHHVAYCRDAQLLSTLWIDGSLAGTSTTPALASTINAVPLYLGRRGPGGPFSNYFNGEMDELRISHVARYAAPFRPAPVFDPDPNTALLLHFDEGNGAVAFDASGNGNHAFLGGTGSTTAESPAWINSTHPGRPRGLRFSVNGGVFDESSKTVWDGDLLRFQLDPAAYPALSGSLVTYVLNVGPDATTQGLTPAVTPIFGLDSLTSFSAPFGIGLFLGDGLTLGTYGWGISAPYPAPHLGDAPLLLPLPSGLFFPGIDFRLQAVFSLPDSRALVVGCSNSVTFQSQPPSSGI